MLLQKNRTDLLWKTFTTAREIPRRDGRFSVRRSGPLLLSHAIKPPRLLETTAAVPSVWVCPLLLHSARSCQRKPIISTKIKASLITEPWSGASSCSVRQKLQHQAYGKCYFPLDQYVTLSFTGVKCIQPVSLVGHGISLFSAAAH